MMSAPHHGEQEQHDNRDSLLIDKIQQMRLSTQDIAIQYTQFTIILAHAELFSQGCERKKLLLYLINQMIISLAD